MKEFNLEEQVAIFNSNSQNKIIISQNTPLAQTYANIRYKKIDATLYFNTNLTKFGLNIYKKKLIANNIKELIFLIEKEEKEYNLNERI
jgi:hypothetical protein